MTPSLTEEMGGYNHSMLNRDTGSSVLCKRTSKARFSYDTAHILWALLKLPFKGDSKNPCLLFGATISLFFHINNAFHVEQKD